MLPLYERERAVLQAVYAGLVGIENFRQEVDHLVPKRATVNGQHVATGLHTLANLGPLPSTLNKRKRASFDPEENRYQRPANRHAGGAFDPMPTEKEAKVIRRLRSKYGISLEESMETLKASLETLAVAYEKYLKVVHGVTLE
ncbi:hypothetical protein NOV72_03296 [Caballeronia novacaledonica]|uniref:Uncharacterized protein n=1 Tax=Caballeronia novacaledonica TaxID=1544861 RepID=A0A2U3I7C7_9BURK|nr:hypothetical protein [Caballeronia novacaledonica]SPB16096.1 hypothetical protein NOV72_03296 [Caballeronia novacaledonica]